MKKEKILKLLAPLYVLVLIAVAYLVFSIKHTNSNDEAKALDAEKITHYIPMWTDFISSSEHGATALAASCHETIKRVFALEPGTSSTQAIKSFTQEASNSGWSMPTDAAQDPTMTSSRIAKTQTKNLWSGQANLMVEETGTDGLTLAQKDQVKGTITVQFDAY